ncbi:Fe3+-siderophore ABC transporter substrate-binding protein [Yersinia kristensenii]|nr:Fe3+-siderophore ABC transporter substrate-binding protein [Yersinia kristensenii]SUP67817.1 iron-hydroxamate transporter substrate-binding subunit [Yersinia kristensenii]
MKNMHLSRRHCLKILLALPLINSSLAMAAPSNKRIVAINWLAAETLLSLGIVPLAVSDSEYFRRRINTPPLPEGVLDIGPFWEPNIELLSALKPSLIFSDFLAPALLDNLRRVATVQVVSVYPSVIDVWQGLTQFTAQLGQQLQIESAAARFIQEASTAIEHCRQQLSHIKSQRILVVVRSQDGQYATVYGRNSLADAVLHQLGMSNAWIQPVSAMGTANVGIEKLASLPVDKLLYTELPTTLTQVSRLRQADGLWQRLPLVAQNKTREMSHIFPFGGLATAVNLAQNITAAILESHPS